MIANLVDLEKNITAADKPYYYVRLCENSETSEAVEEGHHVSFPFESVIP